MLWHDLALHNVGIQYLNTRRHEVTDSRWQRIEPFMLPKAFSAPAVSTKIINVP
jgi:hypothetical protein